MSEPNANSVAAAPDHLAPPGDLELTPPQPVAAVAPESASGRVKLRPEDTAELDSQVRAFVDAVASLDEQDPKFKECLDRVHTMGNKDIELSGDAPKPRAPGPRGGGR